jgi:hypothetical protein
MSSHEEGPFGRLVIYVVLYKGGRGGVGWGGGEGAKKCALSTNGVHGTVCCVAINAITLINIIYKGGK